MAELDGKWEGMEEVNNPNLVMGVPRMIGDLLALGRPTKDKVTPRRKLIVHKQAVAYLMGEASRLGSGSVLWGKGE